MNENWFMLINSIISGIIGGVFGFLIAWYSYRLERKRDEVKRKQENELRELEKVEQAKKQLREQLLQDIQNPEAIHNLMYQLRKHKHFAPQKYTDLELVQLVHSVLNLILEEVNKNEP